MEEVIFEGEGSEFLGSVRFLSGSTCWRRRWLVVRVVRDVGDEGPALGLAIPRLSTALHLFDHRDGPELLPNQLHAFLGYSSTCVR